MASGNSPGIRPAFPAIPVKWGRRVRRGPPPSTRAWGQDDGNSHKLPQISVESFYYSSTFASVEAQRLSQPIELEQRLAAAPAFVEAQRLSQPAKLEQRLAASLASVASQRLSKQITTKNHNKRKIHERGPGKSS